MTTITNETRVRVCRQVKQEGGDYSDPKFLMITTVENLSELLGLRHRDATKRVIADLGYKGLCMLYRNDGSGICHAVMPDYDTNR